VSDPKIDILPLAVPVASVQSAVLEERRRLRDAELVGHSGSWDWNVVSGVITWSDGLFALHGLDPMNFDGGYDQAASRVHEDDRPLVDETMMACRSHDAVQQFRYRVHRASDGEIRWFESRAQGVFENGRLVRLTGAVADVTDRVQAEQQLGDANRFLNAVLTASPDFTFITDLRTGERVFGSGHHDLLGRDESDRAGPDAIERMVHPDDQEALLALNQQSTRLNDGEILQMRYRLRHANGHWHWMSRIVVPFKRDESGSVIEVLGVLRDITEVVSAEEKLLHSALHDPLTGLPNRSLLVDRLESALGRSTRERRDVGVLYCDLDGFKDVNDSAGHAAGDAVLIEVSQRLLGTIREGDTVARLGGDEFVIVVEPWNRSTRTTLAKGSVLSVEVAQRVLRALAKPLRVDGVDYDISASIGVAYRSAADSGTNAERAATIIGDADAAMYEAKKNGKNRIEVFGEGPVPQPQSFRHAAADERD
jgi:diguanylate cyclase (GGDEF)-like protein/PAS domain S-box-containing protein